MEGETDKSIFNAGLAKIERIHLIRKSMIKFIAMDDLENWEDMCEAWRNEIDYKFNATDRETANDYETKIDYSIRIKNPLTRKQIKDYTRWLGKKEFEFGLGMPDKEDEWDDDEM